LKRPDVFIVGAFKSGSTAMYEYLRQHPRLYMPAVKEPLYFGSDLTPRYRRMTEDEYLALFKAAADNQRAGEASPWYLYSTQAAREILDFAPSALAIVLLRNPVDVMYAQHSQLVFNRREDIADFGEALAAEPDRLEGRRIPADALRPEALYYRRSVRFADQLRHWFDVFGRDRMHVIVFDDLVSDPRTVYRETLQFLGVDPSHEVDLTVYNPNRRARSGRIQRLIFAPPRPVRALFGKLRSLPIAHRVRDRLVNANSRKAARAEMDPALRRSLTEEFAPQVADLGSLIGRDLSAWSRV
jgi:hypothetical protein